MVHVVSEGVDDIWCMMGWMRPHLKQIEMLHTTSPNSMANSRGRQFRYKLAWYQSEMLSSACKTRPIGVRMLLLRAGAGHASFRVMLIPPQLCCTTKAIRSSSPLHPCVANIYDLLNKHALLAAPHFTTINIGGILQQFLDHRQWASTATA